MGGVPEPVGGRQGERAAVATELRGGRRVARVASDALVAAMSRAAFSRRGLLASAAAAGLATLLGACGMRFRTGRKVGSLDDAVGLMREELGERFGMAFSPAADPNPYDDGSRYSVRTLSCDLVPDGDPSRVFSATVRADAETGEVLGSTLCDWPQYLFRGRFLAPFAESLSGAAGLAGWGLTMTYARYDSRAWRERDFDAYVGLGASGDPTARAFLVVPAGMGTDDLASLIADATIPLYGLGRNLEVVAAEEGRGPFPRWLYSLESSYTVAATRPGAPGLPEVRDGLERAERNARGKPANDPWDGTATGGDPCLESYLPQVTWNPGHGPGAR